MDCIVNLVVSFINSFPLPISYASRTVLSSLSSILSLEDPLENETLFSRTIQDCHHAGRSARVSQLGSCHVWVVAMQWDTNSTRTATKRIPAAPNLSPGRLSMHHQSIYVKGHRQWPLSAKLSRIPYSPTINATRMSRVERRHPQTVLVSSIHKHSWSISLPVESRGIWETRHNYDRLRCWSTTLKGLANALSTNHALFI